MRYLLGSSMPIEVLPGQVYRVPAIRAQSPDRHRCAYSARWRQVLQATTEEGRRGGRCPFVFELPGL